VYRHFPLSSIHPNAQKAAEASECVAEQGGNDAFWEFADMMFESGLGRDNYIAYAEDLGLNVATFTDCFDSGKFAQKVADDLADGSAAGVRGTPGSVIVDHETGETRIVSGALPMSSFQSIIDTLKNS
jgi:protein-disulfide isomerase